MSPPGKAADGGKAAWPATNVAARRVRARGARPKQPRPVTVACHGVASERSETRRRKLRRSGDGRMAGRQHAPARITPGVVTANPHGTAVFEENEFEWRRHECAKRPTGVPRHAFRGGWTCFLPPLKKMFQTVFTDKFRVRSPLFFGTAPIIPRSFRFITPTCFTQKRGKLPHRKTSMPHKKG